MFGSEILDIIIGLMFVYLLLSLVCSAINEYIASILNKRGKVLFDGLERLLKDSGVADQFYKHPLVESVLGEKARADAYMARERYVRDHWLPGFRWIYRLVSWLRPRDRDLRHFRLASYLPARTFALALLDAAGYNDPARRRAGAGQTGGNPGQGGGTGGQGATPTGQADTSPGPKAGDSAGTAPRGAANAGQGGAGGATAGAAAGQGGDPTWTPLRRVAGGLTPEFEKVLQTLMRDSAIDVTEFASMEAAVRLAASGVPAALKTRAESWISEKEYELQKLHDSVEVWFNNYMDRISGAYKRHVQAVLFVIGLVLSIAVNADTIDLWRRLSTDDKLRDGLAANAANTFRLMSDSTATGAARIMADGLRPVSPDSADQAHAKMLYDSTLATLNRTQLQLGWSTDEAVALGVLAPRGSAQGEWRVVVWPWRWEQKVLWPKLIGLLVTAFALSLGAPFWFDMLNKVINIRNAGRAPQERSKNPEATGKRPAEQPTK